MDKDYIVEIVGKIIYSEGKYELNKDIHRALHLYRRLTGCYDDKDNGKVLCEPPNRYIINEICKRLVCKFTTEKYTEQKSNLNYYITKMTHYELLKMNEELMDVRKIDEENKISKKETSISLDDKVGVDDTLLGLLERDGNKHLVNFNTPESEYLEEEMLYYIRKFLGEWYDVLAGDINQKDFGKKINMSQPSVSNIMSLLKDLTKQYLIDLGYDKKDIKLFECMVED